MSRFVCEESCCKFGTEANRSLQRAILAELVDPKWNPFASHLTISADHALGRKMAAKPQLPGTNREMAGE